MNKIRLIAIAVLLSTNTLLHGQNLGYNNFCQLGGKVVVTQGLNSFTNVQSSYPKCTVTVYLTGTITTATIFSTPGGAALANPFQANIDGSFLFFASPSACYDVTISVSTSGGSPPMPGPFTYTDICLGSGGSNGTVTNTSGALTAGLPVIGNGGADIKVGTKSGNTTEFANATGALTSGHCAQWDANGNLVDSGGVCGSSVTLKTNGTTNGSQALLNFVNGTNVTITQDGAGNETINSTTPPPPGGGAASPGIAFPVKVVYIWADGNTGPTQVGQGNAPLVVGQTGSGDGLTATELQGRFYQSAATASTSTVISVAQGYGANPNQGSYTFGTLTRWTERIRLGNSGSNFRYWTGLTGGSGGNIQGTVFATDTPNIYYCAFRFSASTDTTWKAVCATSSANQTVVDTGVSLVTASSTLFEIENPSTPGNLTQVLFFINGTQVASITTNLPAADNTATFGQMWVGDNKNTNTSISGGYYYSQMFFNK